MNRFQRGKREQRGTRKRFTRTAEMYQSQAQEASNNFDSWLKPGFSQYKMQDTNVLRILPPEWSDDPTTYFNIKVGLHFNVGVDKGVFLCPEVTFEKPCPICEEVEKAQQEGDKEYAKQLSATVRFLTYVLDRNAEEKDIQLLNMPVGIHTTLASLAVDATSGEIINVDDVDEGYDVSFSRKGKGINTKYEAVSIVRRSTPLSTDERKLEKWLDFVKENSLYDVLNEHSYEYIKNVFEGGSGEQSASSATPINLNKDSEESGASTLPERKVFPYKYEDIAGLEEQILVDLIEEYELFTDAESDQLDTLDNKGFAEAVRGKLVELDYVTKPARRRRYANNTSEELSEVDNRIENLKSRFKK